MLAVTADAAAGEVVPVRTRLAEQRISPNRELGRPGARRTDWPPFAALAAGLDNLLAQARRIDPEHRIRHARPVSAETLRKEMRIGSARARTLVKQVRELHEPPMRAVSDSVREPGQRHCGACGHSGNRQPGGWPAAAGDLAAVAP